MPNREITVGSLVIAERTTAVCDVGERAVCYESTNSAVALVTALFSADENC